MLDLSYYGSKWDPKDLIDLIWSIGFTFKFLSFDFKNSAACCTFFAVKSDRDFDRPCGSNASVNRSLAIEMSFVLFVLNNRQICNHLKMVFSTRRELG